MTREARRYYIWVSRGGNSTPPFPEVGKAGPHSRRHWCEHPFVSRHKIYFRRWRGQQPAKATKLLSFSHRHTQVLFFTSSSSDSLGWGNCCLLPPSPGEKEKTSDCAAATATSRTLPSFLCLLPFALLHTDSGRFFHFCMEGGGGGRKAWDDGPRWSRGRGGWREGKGREGSKDKLELKDPLHAIPMLLPNSTNLHSQHTVHRDIITCRCSKLLCEIYPFVYVFPSPSPLGVRALG